MSRFLKWVLRAYAVAAAYAVAVLVVVLALVGSRGALSGDRLREAFRALRGQPAPGVAAGAPAPAPEADERSRILEQRTLELGKLEDRVTSELAVLRAESAALEIRRREARTAEESAQKAREELQVAKSDSELSANLPILSRMEAPGIIAVLRGADDATFVRYLRAMRPGKAAEVLEALQSDPQFEDDFRRLPPEAPPGAKTRSERLYESFTKVP